MSYLPQSLCLAWSETWGVEAETNVRRNTQGLPMLPWEDCFVSWSWLSEGEFP